MVANWTGVLLGRAAGLTVLRILNKQIRLYQKLVYYQSKAQKITVAMILKTECCLLLYEDN